MSKAEKIPGGAFDLRVVRRPARQRSSRTFESARVRIKCGCCDASVDIHHDEELVGAAINTLEINGVMGTIEQWRTVLGPLLGFDEVPRNKGRVVWKSTI